MKKEFVASGGSRRVPKLQGDTDFADQLLGILMREKNLETFMHIVECVYGIKRGEA